MGRCLANETCLLLDKPSPYLAWDSKNSALKYAHVKLGDGWMVGCSWWVSRPEVRLMLHLQLNKWGMAFVLILCCKLEREVKRETRYLKSPEWWVRNSPVSHCTRALPHCSLHTRGARLREKGYVCTQSSFPDLYLGHICLPLAQLHTTVLCDPCSSFAF